MPIAAAAASLHLAFLEMAFLFALPPTRLMKQVGRRDILLTIFHKSQTPAPSPAPRWSIILSLSRNPREKEKDVEGVVVGGG